MLVCFDKNGILKEQLDSYGNLPRVDSQKFKIFAYFKDLELANYGAAYVRLQRPDLGDSDYPILFMTQANLTYDPTVISPSQSQYFTAGGGTGPNGTYKCYLFDFSMVKDTKGTESLLDDTVVTLLDMPGQWTATITLINTSNSNAANVVGTISFNVGGTASGADPDDNLSYNVITHNAALALAQKLNTDSAYFVREMDGFEANAASGLLPKGYFVEGSVVFDKTVKTFYKINSVTDTADDDYVSCSDYTKLVNMDEKLDVASGILIVENINDVSFDLSQYELFQTFYDRATGSYYTKKLDGLEKAENVGILGSKNALIRYEILLLTTVANLKNITNNYTRTIIVSFLSKDYILDIRPSISVLGQIPTYDLTAFDIADRCFYVLKDALDTVAIARYLFVAANRIDHVELKTTANTVYGVDSSGNQVNFAITDLFNGYIKYFQVPDYQAGVSIITDILTNINGTNMSGYYSYEQITVDGKVAYHIMDADSSENLTQQQAKGYLRVMTGSEYLPEYSAIKPSNSFMMLPDGTILSPQWHNTYGLLLYRRNTYADVNYVNNNILTLSNTSSTLTDEEFAYTLTKNACVLNSNTGVYYEKYSEDSTKILFKALNVGINNTSGVVTLTNTPALVITKSNKNYDFGAAPSEQTYGKGKLDADFATKQYVQQQIENVQKNDFIVVDTTEYPTLASFLLSTGEEGNIYLYPVGTVQQETTDKGYYQYIWENVDGQAGWFCIGTTKIDISNFEVSFEQRSFNDGAVSVEFKNNTDFKLVSVVDTVSVAMTIPSGVSQGWVSSCTFTVGNNIPSFSLTNNSSYNVVFIVNNRKANVSGIALNLDVNGIVECMAECNGFDIRIYMKEVTN